MKTKILIIIGCALFMLLTNIAAQNTQKIEKTINGETYVIDNVMQLIKNKKNGKISRKFCEPPFHFGKFSMEVVIKKSFSEAKIKELSRLEIGILVSICCNFSGEIVEVSFYMSKGKVDVFSLSEIYLLEKNILGKKIEIKSNCPNDKYYSLFMKYNF